jgi:hypothetical protein
MSDQTIRLRYFNLHRNLAPAETAKHAGIGEFCASVLAENATMLAVFHSAGFPFVEEHIGDVVELTMEIGPSCM